MFACLYALSAPVAALVKVAEDFTPRFEVVGPLVMLDVSGLKQSVRIWACADISRAIMSFAIMSFANVSFMIRLQGLSARKFRGPGSIWPEVAPRRVR